MNNSIKILISLALLVINLVVYPCQNTITAHITLGSMEFASSKPQLSMPRSSSSDRLLSAERRQSAENGKGPDFYGTIVPGDGQPCLPAVKTPEKLTKAEAEQKLNIAGTNCCDCWCLRFSFFGR